MKSRIPALLLACIIGLNACTDKKYEAFQQGMKLLVNPKELQNWAVSMLQTNNLYYEIPRNQWPSFLNVTDGPSEVWIAGWTTVKENAVVVAWGNGFGHTGLIVGTTNFVITEADLGRPVIQWIPGVYFSPKPER